MERRHVSQITGIKVLVVEDEYFLADDLVQALREAGALPIGPVASVAEAKSRVSRGGIEAAIIDMNLRGEGAEEVLDLLLRERIPTVLVSGYSAEALPARAAGVPRLEKPAAPQAIIQALAARLQAEQAVRPAAGAWPA